MSTLRFTIIGEPASKGSVTAHHVRAGDGSLVRGFRGEPIIVKHDDNARGKRHAKTVEGIALAAREAAGWPLLRGLAVEVTARFYLPRRKADYRTGRYAGILKDSAPLRPITKPDSDKLMRHLLDSLTGVIYADDGQVVGGPPEKWYAEGDDPPRTEVEITVLEQQTVGVVLSEDQLALVA